MFHALVPSLKSSVFGFQPPSTPLNSIKMKRGFLLGETRPGPPVVSNTGTFDLVSGGSSYGFDRAFNCLIKRQLITDFWTKYTADMNHPRVDVFGATATVTPG